MKYAAIVILVALLQYLYFTIRVGASREKYGVKAPHTSGHELWERLFRVQQNTLEQLIVFIPALVLFSMYLSDVWTLAPGALFLLGRQLYSWEYVNDPASRGPGMGLTFLANAGLIVGATVGWVLRLL